MANVKVKYLIMQNGTEYKVVSEDGRYYYCETTQWKKNCPFIANVVIVEENAKNEKKKGGEKNA